jgi:hypothetical protein
MAPVASRPWIPLRARVTPPCSHADMNMLSSLAHWRLVGGEAGKMVDSRTHDSSKMLIACIIDRVDHLTKSRKPDCYVKRKVYNEVRPTSDILTCHELGRAVALARVTGSGNIYPEAWCLRFAGRGPRREHESERVGGAPKGETIPRSRHASPISRAAHMHAALVHLSRECGLCADRVRSPLSLRLRTALRRIRRRGLTHVSARGAAARASRAHDAHSPTPSPPLISSVQAGRAQLGAQLSICISTGIAGRCVIHN